MVEDLVKLARFPYLPDAQQYIRNAGITIEQLLGSPAYRRVLERGKLRLLDAVKTGEIQPPSTTNHEVELFSYPVARMLLSCINDRYLNVRYAEAESKLARSFLNKYYTEDDGMLMSMALELGIETLRRDAGLWVHFSEYVRLASRVGDDDYRFANQVVSGGMVLITEQKLVRLLQEAVRYRVLEGLPSPVNQDICDRLVDMSAQVSEALKMRRKDYEASLGTAMPDCYPPCIAGLLASLHDGENLSHTARFALTTFLHHIGLAEDTILKLYSSSPDFDEDTALYQIRHVCSKGESGYTPPSCATMQTYGNCVNPDRLCSRVKHPLSYYRAASRSKKKSTGGKGEPDGKTIEPQVKGKENVADSS